jgi:hypothetical protein
VSLHEEMRWGIDRKSHDIPHAKKLDPHVDRKRSLELQAQINTRVVILLIHGTREWQLFNVPLREKPDFLDHAGEGASRVSTTRETKDTDLISGMIWMYTVSFWGGTNRAHSILTVVHQELIPVWSIDQSRGDRATRGGKDRPLTWSPRLRATILSRNLVTDSMIGVLSTLLV